MRPSKRTALLEAAVDLLERDGLAAVTIEAVAAATGVTKGGLLYHFSSRDELVLALHRHVAARWEADLEEAAGAPADDLTPGGRLRAYARTSTQHATRAELVLMIASVDSPEALAVWDEVIDRWSLPTPTAQLAPAELDAHVAQLAADGLWLAETLGARPMPPEVRAQLAEHLTHLGVLD